MDLTYLLLFALLIIIIIISVVIILRLTKLNSTTDYSRCNCKTTNVYCSNHGWDNSNPPNSNADASTTLSYTRSPHYIVISAATFTTKIDNLSTESNLIDGFYIEIVGIPGSANDQLKFTSFPHFEVFYISNIALPKPQAINLANSITVTPEIDQGFNRNYLQYYVDRLVNTDFTLSYINKNELDYLISYQDIHQADHIVISGSIFDTGIPIDGTPFARDGAGNMVTKYFTLKFEAFVQNSELSTSTSTVLTRQFHYLPNKIKPSKAKNNFTSDNRSIEVENSNLTQIGMPLVTASTPCPPRWYPNE